VIASHTNIHTATVTRSPFFISRPPPFVFPLFVCLFFFLSFFLVLVLCNMSKTLEELLAYTSGAIWAIALWMWIDANAYSGAYPSSSSVIINISQPVTDPGVADLPHYVQPKFQHWLPFIFGTIALFFVNLGSHEGLVGGLGEDDDYVNRTRIVTAIALCVLFGSFLGGCIWAGVDLLGENVINKWPGVSMIPSLFFVVVSTLIYRFKRFTERSGDGGFTAV